MKSVFALLPAVLLLSVSALPAASQTAVKDVEYAEDGRQILYLSEAQRSHVKQEMRAFLSGVQAMTQAFADEDRAAIKTAALSMGPKGMGMGKGQGAGMGDGMGFGRGMSGNGGGHGIMRDAPDEFHTFGRGVRRGFLDIADKADTDDLKTLQQAFADNLINCTSCHETFTARDKD